MNEGIVVLSLFDGMSCGQQALKRLGIKVAKYYASEIDKHAIKATQNAFPETEQIGDVTKIDVKALGKIDLLIGGSPCQGFSMAGKQMNFNDPRSALFFEFLRIKKEATEINPDLVFLLENVHMKKEYELTISRLMEVEPLDFNSRSVSAQNRERLYWTNINRQPFGLFGDLRTDIPEPADRGIFLKDILQDNVHEKYFLSENALANMRKWEQRNKENGNGFKLNIKSEEEKSTPLTTGAIKSSATLINVGVLNDRGELREIEKSSCLDANYFKGMDNHAARTMVAVPEIITHSTKPRMGKGNGGKGPLKKTDGKSYCLETKMSNAIEYKSKIRKLTPVECCRLQTVDDDYILDETGKQVISDTQIYRCLGNGWTVEMIMHIISYSKFMPKKPTNT